MKSSSSSSVSSDRLSSVNSLARANLLSHLAKSGLLILFASLCLSAAAQSNQWSWVGGSSTIPASCNANAEAGCGLPGTYGTPGSFTAGSVPGSRNWAASWTDASGNLWVFGGAGYDSVGNFGFLNDLWQFSPSLNAWAWMGGSNVIPAWNKGQPGVYGELGVAAAGNIPAGRDGAVSWTDPAGNFWLFGGAADDTDYYVNSNGNNLNDLWMYNPTLGEWTWMGGNPPSNSTPSFIANYGTKGQFSSGAYPSSLNFAGGVADASGNFWLFGGWGQDSTASYGVLNDLWEFNPVAGQWAWITGAAQTDAGGNYGILQTPAPGNGPCARYPGSMWADAQGNIWLFGGFGYPPHGEGFLNDLWEYSTTTGEWAWMAGNNTMGLVNEPVPITTPPTPPMTGSGWIGIYGTLGVAAAGNNPGSRVDASGWSDSSGNLWLFGGMGFDSLGNMGYLSDLWEFSPVINEWAWISGSNIANQPGVYGTSGTSASEKSPHAEASPLAGAVPARPETTAAGNHPGARQSASPWADRKGNLWIFGGSGYASKGKAGLLNDLWVFKTSATIAPAAAPTFSPAQGTYSSPQSITILDTTKNAAIYYTTDGKTTPTTSSTKYTGAISVASGEKIQAIATASGFSSSAVASATYTLQTAAPSFSPSVGSYSAAQTVTLLDATPGASIYYTTDGKTTPTTSSSKYTSAGIKVSQTATINAIAMETGYANSTMVSGTYTISKSQTITFAQPAAVTYGAKPVTLTATASSGLSVELTLVSGPATLNGNALTFTGAGSVVVGATQPGNSTYAAAPQVTRTITVNKATLTAIAANQSMTYGGTVPALTYKLTGFVNSDTQASATSGAPALSNTAPTAPKVGSYPITIKAGTLAAANYSFSFVNGALTVTKAALTATAQNATMTYGAALPAFKYSLTGFINGDRQSSATTGSAKLTTTATAASSVGTYTIVIAAGTLAAPNYTVTYVNGTLAIGQAALGVNANSLTRIYGAANPALTYTLKGLVNGDTAAKAVAGAPALSTTATAGSPVGSYPINIAAGTMTAKNYALQFNGATMVVTKASLTVTANNLTMKQGSTLPALTYAISGFVNSDTQAKAVTGAPILATTATSKSTPGSYPITVTTGTLAAANYNLNLANGAMTVTK